MRYLFAAVLALVAAPAWAQFQPNTVLQSSVLNAELSKKLGRSELAFPRLRTLGAMFDDVKNVLNYGPISDLGTALTAACNAISATGGKVILPGGGGVYQLATMVTACAGKPISLEGDGSGATTINMTTSAAGITIAQTSLAQTVKVRGLMFTSTATALVPRALDISFPLIVSTLARTLTVEDVTVQSAPPPTITLGAQVGTVATSTTPYPSGIGSAMRISGAWFAKVDNVSFQGPVMNTNTPLAGTSGVELRDCYSTDIPSLKAEFADAAVLQSAYSEYVRIDAPQFVAVNYGVNITNAPRADKSNRRGLSYYVSAGELDVVVAGLNLVGINDVYVWGNHFYNSRGASGAAVVLSDTNRAQIFGNSVIQGDSNPTVTAVLVNGTSAENKIFGNTFNTAASVSFQPGTVANVAWDNTTDAPYVGAIGDLGTGNSIMRRRPDGAVQASNGHIFAGIAGQGLASIPEVPNAVNTIGMRAGATGVGPAVVASGPGADVTLNLQAKGAGPVAVLSPLVISPGALPTCGTTGVPPQTICMNGSRGLQVTP